VLRVSVLNKHLEEAAVLLPFSAVSWLAANDGSAQS